MQSLKQNITQMKKTIYLLLLASLAIAGCVATREIPLTVNPEIYATAEQLDSLPILPSDLSQIKYIHLPDSLIGEDKNNLPTQMLTKDLMESYDMVQLDALPGVNIRGIFDIQADDDLLFVTYDVLQKDGESEGPRVHAIYTRKGKLVAQIGNPIRSVTKTDKDGRKTSVPYKEIDNDTQYVVDSRIQLNRKKKEVYFNEMGHKQVYFDYHGNYKRTEYSQIVSYNMLTTQNRKIGFHINHYVDSWNKFYCTVLNENGKPTGVAFKDDPLYIIPWISREGLVQVDDDIMLGFEKSDTIWQILPDRKVASFVCTGALRASEKIKNNTQYGATFGDHTITKLQVTANSNYVLINFTYNSRWYYMMYDISTGHSVMWMPNFEPDPTLIQSNLSTTVDYMLLADGTLLGTSFKTPLEWKKEMSLELDPETAFLKRHDKREEEFIRNLKLDGGPVLFFVKLKKF